MNPEEANFNVSWSLAAGSTYYIPSENWRILQREIETHWNSLLLDSRLPDVWTSYIGTLTYRPNDCRYVYQAATRFRIQNLQIFMPKWKLLYVTLLIYYTNIYFIFPIESCFPLHNLRCDTLFSRKQTNMWNRYATLGTEKGYLSR